MSDITAKIHEAFQLVLLDTDLKYDECLVNRLFDKVNLLDTNHLLVIKNLITELYSKEKICQVKLTRLLRLHRKIIVHDLTIDNDKCTTIFFETIPYLLAQDHDDCMSDLLELLHGYSLSGACLRYVIFKPFNQPVEKILTLESVGKPQTSYVISDSLDIIGYCYKKSKNYHVLEKARLLMRSLIECTYCSDSNSVFYQRVKRFVDDLMISGSNELYKCVLGIVSTKLSSGQERFYREQLKPIIKKTFDLAVHKNDNKNLVVLSSLRSTITEPCEASNIIETLKDLKNLDSIIAFITHNVDLIENIDVLKYIVFPILIKCNSENAHVMIQRLHLTREEKVFIDRYKSDKHLVHCFKYIHDITYARKERNSSYIQRKQIYLFEVLLEYLESQHTLPGAFKNVFQSMTILKYARHLLVKKSEMLWVFKCIDRVLKLIKNLNQHNSMHVPLIIEYIKLLSDNLYMVTYFRQDFELAEKVSKYFMEVVELAFNYNDCDILIEFVHLFSRSSFQFILDENDDSEQNEHHERYVALIWHHIRKIALEGDHQELPGTLTDLLIAIDLYIDPRILHKQNIHRRRDIPKYLGDILNEYSSRIQTIEALIQRLRCAKITEVDAPINRGSKNEMTYLCFLDCDPLLRRGYSGLNYVIKGLCLAAKGEIKTELRLQAMEEIMKLFDEFLINECNIRSILKRLIKTGILQTFYELATNSLDGGMLKKFARITISNIQKFTIDKLPEKRETLIDLLTSHARKNSDEIVSSQVSFIEKVANFYSNAVIKEFDEGPDISCEISFETYLKEIINQQYNDAHILECY